MLPNPTLARIRANAQSDANRENKPLVILNLNRFNPLYVIRALSAAQIEAAKATGQYVETINPQA